MRRHFVSGFPRALISLSQEKSPGVEIGVVVQLLSRTSESRSERKYICHEFLLKFIIFQLTRLSLLLFLVLINKT